MAAPEQVLTRPVEFDWDGHHFICWVDDQSSIYLTNPSLRPWPRRHHQLRPYKSRWWVEVDGGPHRALFRATPDDTNEAVKPRIIAWFQNRMDPV